ncbi:aminotransferase class I/II-fold pyridoxal phosphate-dependent enzyme [Krasilnikovia sp. M28-CT-15]|uniref:aminotransferase class I/II-fold pyridoxal phosphate-dependent enzyme n=1 Tax=Krasilnikovia sp. M28-CT-15 TaxID=3373540 RepID=UPI003877087D
MKSTLTPRQEQTLAAHQRIDLTARTSDLPFVSGWETSHGITYEHLKPLYADQLIDGGHALDYTFMADDELLVEKIRGFHRTVDGHFPDASEIFLGAGSSPLLSSVMILLSQMGETEICYVPPIYHAYYQLAKIGRMRMTPIGEGLTLEGEQRTIPQLPDRRTVLLLTDPSWISGRAYSAAFHAEIRAWQERTGSTVIVDGTFQYTKWAAMAAEQSATLVPEQTIRLICPTKSLCVHGVRCAYLILPKTLQEDLGWYYCKLVAATSQYDVRAAHLLFDQLLSPNSNRALTALVSERYAGLTAAGIITDLVTEPQCTYYAWGRLGIGLDRVLFMNGSYFELPYPDDYLRINLLSAPLARLLDARSSLELAQ